MTKLKRARTLMAIILISVCGWVAVVGLVIKPPFWLGAILAILGGIAIGTVVAYLMSRWWFYPSHEGYGGEGNNERRDNCNRPAAFKGKGVT